MPRPVLGESCTTSIKDLAIFLPHQKTKKILTLDFVECQSLRFVTKFMPIIMPILIIVTMRLGIHDTRRGQNKVTTVRRVINKWTRI